MHRHRGLRTFIRRFGEATGVSPGEWVSQERVARARSLLEATGMSVEDVATAVGFGSANALRHHFRAAFATSPVRCRNHEAARDVVGDL
jgi:AraC family transcriptional regulator, transcriptional activator FtrA